MDTYECYELLNQEPEDAEEIEALYPEFAAEEYAERYDDESGEGATPEQDIMVRLKGEKEFIKYTVYMQMWPNYSAVKVDKK